MWDLPGPGIEPVSPALAGGFLTTAPPGKSLESDFKLNTMNTTTCVHSELKNLLYTPYQGIGKAKRNNSYYTKQFHSGLSLSIHISLFGLAIELVMSPIPVITFC